MTAPAETLTIEVTRGEVALILAALELATYYPSSLPPGQFANLRRQIVKQVIGAAL